MRNSKCVCLKLKLVVNGAPFEDVLHKEMLSAEGTAAAVAERAGEGDDMADVRTATKMMMVLRTSLKTLPGSCGEDVFPVRSEGALQCC